MEVCMNVLQYIDNGTLLNTVEKFHIYKETVNRNKLNDMDTDAHNAMFYDLLFHLKPENNPPLSHQPQPTPSAVCTNLPRQHLPSMHMHQATRGGASIRTNSMA
jgi:hypothetical protein